MSHPVGLHSSDNSPTTCRSVLPVSEHRMQVSPFFSRCFHSICSVFICRPLLCTPLNSAAFVCHRGHHTGHVIGVKSASVQRNIFYTQCKPGAGCHQAPVFLYEQLKTKLQTVIINNDASSIHLPLTPIWLWRQGQGWVVHPSITYPMSL